MENNLKNLLEKTKNYFEKTNEKKARLLAENIFSEVLKIDRINLYSEYDRILNIEEINKIKEKIRNFKSVKNEEVKEDTIRYFIEKTKKYLDKNNILESNMITNIIFSHILKLDISMIFTKYNEKLEKEDQEKIKRILKKLVVDKLPIQYIFNEQIFYGHYFYVNKSVLIPRIDTEVVVEKALELIVSKSNPLVLDIGTGSGAIGVTIAIENPTSKVLATDISEQALQVASKNAKNLNVKNIKFLQSNLFENISFNKFDLIVSNPPYIKDDELEYMSETTILHEPKEALFANENGLYFYYEISKQALNYLSENGILLFEIGFKQAKQVKNILENLGYKNIVIGKDLNLNDRYVYAMKG